MIEVHSTSPDDTLSLGRRLAPLLGAGDIVLLAGPLGAGKTLFVSGVAEGLGSSDLVSSPTFVLVRRYDGLMPVYHADVYRLGSSGEFADLDLVDEARDGVLLIEWGQAVAQAVPSDHLLIEIEVVGDKERTFRFQPRGAWEERSLEDLKA